jgi:hypothetical protein
MGLLVMFQYCKTQKMITTFAQTTSTSLSEAFNADTAPVNEEFDSGSDVRREEGFTGR